MLTMGCFKATGKKIVLKIIERINILSARDIRIKLMIPKFPTFSRFEVGSIVK